ncbi:signal peptidase I [Shimia haliotis]|uniref:Signal peptidase I n=1 Tax=Shimia haliotis TaxID=1280847 RepID=A0A1I4DNU7_9RHOB|nr:signal peptidase I [Shimia haliotis]SFK95254.1 signal peptidase I . Serine peptidase. MEROPS family S26A [Shimia haliotis]
MADKAKQDNGIVETIKTIVYALLIAGVFRTLFFQPFWIPSGSMKDTLLIGDFLFVNKMTYGYSYASCPSIRIQRLGINIDAKDICGWFDGDNTRLFGGEPERGDVVVFRHPVSGQDYIKRLIGMPGDKVQIKAGLPYINGVPVKQMPDGVFEELKEPQGPERRPPSCENDPVGLGGVCVKSRAIETLPNGKSYAVLNIGNRSEDNTGIYTVPEGQYFFMGDNRDNSIDSRVGPARRGVGFVPYENLIGRADRIMFSSGGRSMFYFWTWRGDRFFKAIE